MVGTTSTIFRSDSEANGVIGLELDGQDQPPKTSPLPISLSTPHGTISEAVTDAMAGPARRDADAFQAGTGPVNRDMAKKAGLAGRQILQDQTRREPLSETRLQAENEASLQTRPPIRGLAPTPILLGVLGDRGDVAARP